MCNGHNVALELFAGTTPVGVLAIGRFLFKGVVSAQVGGGIAFAVTIHTLFHLFGSQALIPYLHLIYHTVKASLVHIAATNEDVGKLILAYAVVAFVFATC